MNPAPPNTIISTAINPISGWSAAAAGSHGSETLRGARTTVGADVVVPTGGTPVAAPITALRVDRLAGAADVARDAVMAVDGAAVWIGTVDGAAVGRALGAGDAGRVADEIGDTGESVVVGVVMIVGPVGTDDADGVSSAG